MIINDEYIDIQKVDHAWRDEKDGGVSYVIGGKTYWSSRINDEDWIKFVSALKNKHVVKRKRFTPRV